jgi:hypothetical protein
MIGVLIGVYMITDPFTLGQIGNWDPFNLIFFILKIISAAALALPFEVIASQLERLSIAYCWRAAIALIVIAGIPLKMMLQPDLPVLSPS